jgi:hypothetical protein
MPEPSRYQTSCATAAPEIYSPQQWSLLLALAADAALQVCNASPRST